MELTSPGPSSRIGMISKVLLPPTKPPCFRGPGRRLPNPPQTLNSRLKQILRRGYSSSLQVTVLGRKAEFTRSTWQQEARRGRRLQRMNGQPARRREGVDFATA